MLAITVGGQSQSYASQETRRKIVTMRYLRNHGNMLIVIASTSNLIYLSKM